MPAIKKPPISTNGTAITVSVVASLASGVPARKRIVSAPESARQAIVSPMIQPAEMSRSRSSPVAAVLADASVATNPPTTGFASRASVQIAATPIVPAPMKRTWRRQMNSACASKSVPVGAGCR
jgi:hypothetical protein